MKKGFNSYQVKCIKEFQNVKDALLKKLSDIEQAQKEILRKKNMIRNFNHKSRYYKSF